MRSNTRKAAVVLIAAVALQAFLSPSADASTFHPRRDRADNIAACPIHWGRSLVANKRLVRCEAELFHVSVSRTQCVASHESGYRWWIYVSGNGGTMQQRVRFWWGRFRTWAKAGGFFKSILNSRTNLIVSMQMVLHGGWGPWTSYWRYCV